MKISNGEKFKGEKTGDVKSSGDSTGHPEKHTLNFFIQNQDVKLKRLYHYLKFFIWNPQTLKILSGVCVCCT